MKLSSDNRGAIAIITLLTIMVFAIIVMATVSVLAIDDAQMGSADIASEKTFYAAEAGINEALKHISLNPIPGNFDLPLSVSDGVQVHIAVAPNPADPYQRIVTSTAEDTTGKQRTLEIVANATSYASSFDYAVQSGQGGFKMANATVIGDLFSDGSIDAANSSQILGNTWVAIEDPTLTYPHRDNVPTTVKAFGKNAGDKVVAQSFSTAVDTPVKRIQVYLRKHSNPNNNITLRLVADTGANNPSNTVISQATISKNDISGAFSWIEVSFPIPPLLVGGRTYWLTLDANAVDTKYYEWDLDTNAAAFPGEARQTTDFSTGAWNVVNGDFAFKTFGVGATSASNVTVGTSAKPKNLHAKNILNSSEIWGDAYYDSKDAASIVHGASHPSTNDLPKPFPIQDADITNWENIAAAGGNLTAGDVDTFTPGVGGAPDTYTITSARSFGPKKIVGNLILDNGANLTLTGNIWVTGNITFAHPGAHVQLAASFGPLSGVVITDGQIVDKNNSVIRGSGDPKSFPLFISTLNLIDTPAIDTSNNSRSVIYYAPFGVIHLDQNGYLNSALAYYIEMDQGSTVEYNSALQGFTLPPEPGRVFGVESGTWQEK